MKKSGNTSIKAAKQIWGATDVGSIDLRAAEKPGINKTAEADVSFGATQFFSPMITGENWYLPRSRKMLLKWVKIYADRDPYFCSILKMHARYPISEFNVVTENKNQRELFEAVFHQSDWDIMDSLREIATSFTRYGESILMSQWDPRYKIWTSSTCLDPGLIEVEEISFTNKVRLYAEIPKKYMKLYKSKDKQDEEDKNRMPPEIVEVIKAGGKYVELDTQEEGTGMSYDPARVCMITNKSDVGEDGLRGLPPIFSLLRAAVYEEFLHKAQFERAKRYAYPIEFWKLGDVAKDIFPSSQDLKNVRELLRGALAAPPYSIIYSPLLSLEVIGSTGALLNITDDLAFVENQKLVGLGTNKNIILGEGSWLGASKTISMQRLIMDYEVDREMYTRKILKGHYMRALCMAHGYTAKSPITGLTIPIVPGINWARDLDPQNRDDNRKDMYEKYKAKIVSGHTLFSLYPELDWDREQVMIDQEANSYIENGEVKIKKPEPKADVDTSLPVKPSAPTKPVKPVDDKEKGDEKDEKVIREVSAPLQPPPPKPEPKKEKVVKEVKDEK